MEVDFADWDNELVNCPNAKCGLSLVSLPRLLIVYLLMPLLLYRVPKDSNVSLYLDDYLSTECTLSVYPRA